MLWPQRGKPELHQRGKWWVVRWYDPVSKRARAINIRKTFGARSAARYLYRRGWSLSAALWLVAGAALREGYDDITPWELTQAEDAHILNHYEDYYKA